MHPTNPARAAAPHLRTDGRRVRTLTGPDFQAACAELYEIVHATYEPDLLVGIRTGGLIVAEEMARVSGRVLPVLPLTCRRGGTATKSRFRTVLAGLPRPIVDQLRIMEHRVLSSRRRAGKPIQPVDHTESVAIGNHLHPGARVLVVDDAVDSGVTLATVLGTLRERCPEGGQVRSAVVTVTTHNPVAVPDFAWSRGTLYRFPWSFDAAS
ncbi:MAG: hypothetical protein JO227_10110 [Acetobacteraceae bacterium]|nr:hypothetical protein [Acetobacteraceae bacterium]